MIFSTFTPMKKTKLKVITAAIDLFNEQGLVNVSNQDIAKKAGISLSNFNYHFKTKADLVYTVCEFMRAELENRISGNQVLTGQGKGLDLSRVYFEFERDYRFFYLDTHNILQTYPSLKKEMQQQINECIQIIKNLNYLSIGMGYMKPEPPEMPGLYDRVAQQIWINSHFWLAQTNIRGIEDSPVVEGLEAYYVICYPYLTPAGITSYRSFIDNLKEEKKQKETQA